jgi:hypothetical protein
MSQDFHKPTYTFPNGAYNATEVRLYGRPGIFQKSGEVTVNDKTFNISVSVKQKEASRKKESNKTGKVGIFDWGIPEFEMMPTSGILLETFEVSQLIMVLSAKIIIKGTEMKGREAQEFSTATWGVIFGYAYEGHYFDLPKPKLMLLPVDPEKIPVDDAGYSEKPGYMVWVVDKLNRCAEFEMNQGFIKELVLEANLPGKRSPTMYAARMMMGHRSGRLTE